MLSTRQAKEVLVRMPNEIGALDRMSKTVADKGVNLLAISAWVEGPHAIIRLVTEDNVRVLDLLKSMNYEVREADVLMAELPHKPGMLHRICERLALGGIDIHHLYATAAVAQDHSIVVFATAHNDRAMVLLNTPNPK